MIVDCHTHIWQSAEQMGLLRAGGRSARPARSNREAAWPSQRQQATIEQHIAASKPVDVAFVLGFVSRHLKVEVPNRFIADYARQRPDRIIGFAGIDPTDGASALEEVQRARAMGLRGLVVAPASQAMHPAHSNAMRVYELAERLSLPVIVHNGLPLSPQAHLEFARPYLLDEVARSFPSLKILITHMGFPWVDEAFVLLAKHENVFAEISGVAQRPWLTLQHMQGAHEVGMMDKLLFGSDFPFSSPKVVIESLYSLNQVVHGSNLPSVPREQLRGIVERNSLALLGIDFEVKSAQPEPEPDSPPEPAPARPDTVASREPEQSA